MPKRKSSDTKSKSKVEAKGEKKQKAAQIKDGLQKTNASDLLSMMKDGSAITVEADSSIYNALLTLNTNKIHGAPVVDAKKKVLGFVDLIDLVAAIVEAASKAPKSAVDSDGENMAEKFAIDNTLVKNIVDLSKRDDFVVVDVNDDAAKIAEILSQRDHHRVAVRDKEEFKGVITQSALVEYVSEEYADKMEKDKTHIGDLSLPKKVYTVKESSTALEAFKLMKSHRVSGLGVVNENGRLVGAISVSDLMLWTEWIAGGVEMRFTDLTGLNKNINEFLADSRAQKSMPKVSPKTCTKKTKVSDAIGDMLVNNVHRLFLVDDANKPSSVVTYDIIIKYLLQL